jgi:hypothetical protein
MSYDSPLYEVGLAFLGFVIGWVMGHAEGSIRPAEDDAQDAEGGAA